MVATQINPILSKDSSDIAGQMHFRGSPVLSKPLWLLPFIIKLGLTYISDTVSLKVMTKARWDGFLL